MKGLLEGFISIGILLGTVRRRRLRSWLCIGGGFIACVVSVSAYAQASSSGPVPLDAVTFFQYVAMTTGGVGLALVGWYMNGLDARVETTRISLLENYLTEPKTRQLVEDILGPLRSEIHHANESLAALHRRFDKLKVPAAAAED